VTKTLAGPDNTFILQFNSDHAAKEALEKLESVCVFAEPDIVVSIDAGYLSWGVTHIGGQVSGIPKFYEYAPVDGGGAGHRR